MLKTDFHAHTRNIGDMVYWCVQYSIQMIKVTQSAFIVAYFLASSYLDKSINYYTTYMYVEVIMAPVTATWLFSVLIQLLSATF